MVVPPNWRFFTINSWQVERRGLDRTFTDLPPAKLVVEKSGSANKAAQVKVRSIWVGLGF